MILYLGILTGCKRPERLIRALPRLIEKVPDVLSYSLDPMPESWRRSARWRSVSV